MENPVLIFGANAIGKSALDIFINNGVLVYGFLDEDTEKQGQEIGDVSILGQPDDDGFLKLIGSKCEAFIATDVVSERKALVKLLNDRRKTQPVNAIHEQSTISTLAEIGHGNFVAAGVVVQAFAKMADHCLIQSGVIIEAEAQLENYVHLGVGAKIGQGVTIAEGAFIGTGAIVVSGVSIGKNASVGAGSLVIENVAANTTVFGNPAKKV